MLTEESCELKVSRRSVLKWTGALAGVATLSSISPIRLFKKISPVEAQATDQEVVLTSSIMAGPFFAHVKGGRLIRCTPLMPNLPVTANAFAFRNRLYAPDRISYPMRRVDFDPNGNRNTQNRGSMNFVRISWQEALDLVANEIKRVMGTYGTSAIFAVGPNYWLAGSLHSGAVTGGLGSKFFSLLGEYTVADGEGSAGGWCSGGWLIWGGFSIYITGYSFLASISSKRANSNYADILQNSEMVICWANDTAVMQYSIANMQDAIWFEKIKKAGIKIVVVDPRQNDTAAIYADTLIPIIPGTDEAMLAAIAYVWITENLYDKNYVATHTVGFDESTLPTGAPANSSFKAYVMGTADGIPKTPKWAEAICGVDSAVIVALAREWATKRTNVECYFAGANRRRYGAEFVRMIVTLQAMLGYIGKPGCGIGNPVYPSPTNMKGPSFAQTPHPSGIMPPNLPPMIHHVQFGKAILNPPITWTVGDYQFTYPQAGRSEVKMLYNTSGTGYFLNQMGTINEHMKGLKSPKLEIVISQAAFWHAGPYCSDVVLPAAFVGERDDMTSWVNYAIYSHKLVNPLGEAKNETDIYRELATRLGILDKLFGGQSDEDLLKGMYANTNIPMTYDEFKAKGYYKWSIPAMDSPSVGMQAFHDDPVKNPIATPTGKLEIYSTRVAKAFGTADPQAPTIPKYIESPESTHSPKAQTYPLTLVSPHCKFGYHSQSQNQSWQRDYRQCIINGHKTLGINPIDAAARGIRDGDTVRVFNDYGQILSGAKVTERVMPGVVWTVEGGHYAPQKPGVLGTLDLGGNANVLMPAEPSEKINHGQIASGLVQVERWTE